MFKTHAFRLLLVTAMAASLLVVAAPPSSAHHRPNFYCGESGDICQGSRKVDGVRKLWIGTAARYFGTFHLCVYDHREGNEWCAPYKMREQDSGIWSRSVAWFRKWPAMRHRGRFTVSWWVGEDRIGKKLGFHVH